MINISRRKIMLMVRAFTSVIIAILMSGCGTVVPAIQEFPNGDGDAQLLVHSIVSSIHCEVRTSLSRVFNNEEGTKFGNKGRTYADFLWPWGVQIQLSLTMQEKTTLSPSVVGFPAAPVGTLISLAGGGTASADASRVDKLSYFYSVKDLVKLGPCDTGYNESKSPSLLLQSDLKLFEWLSTQVLLNKTQEIDFPNSPKNAFKQNVLSHQVKFEVDKSASFTPGFKIVEVALNQTGTFLTASRNKTHDLTITFGPIDPSQPQTLARPAQDVALAAQIASALAANRITIAPLP